MYKESQFFWNQFYSFATCFCAVMTDEEDSECSRAIHNIWISLMPGSVAIPHFKINMSSIIRNVIDILKSMRCYTTCASFYANLSAIPHPLRFWGRKINPIPSHITSQRDACIAAHPYQSQPRHPHKYNYHRCSKNPTFL